MTLSTACGLRCYSCVTSDSHSCKNYVTCPPVFDRCFTLDKLNLITKGCQSSIACIGGMECCSKDLCNSTGAAGPSIVLLLASSAIITLFL
uniref:Prostate stem cell antigen-like n=2 Tax=Salarias fasciatus TaxID=181472 RepID=A0A672J507_SALFA